MRLIRKERVSYVIIDREERIWSDLIIYSAISRAHILPTSQLSKQRLLISNPKTKKERRKKVRQERLVTFPNSQQEKNSGLIIFSS